MSPTTPTSQESIDAEPTAELRTRRAAEGCMIVVPEGDASGLFDVYSANDTVTTRSIRPISEQNGAPAPTTNTAD